MTDIHLIAVYGKISATFFRQKLCDEMSSPTYILCVFRPDVLLKIVHLMWSSDQGTHSTVFAVPVRPAMRHTSQKQTFTRVQAPQVQVESMDE